MTEWLKKLGEFRLTEFDQITFVVYDEGINVSFKLSFKFFIDKFPATNESIEAITNLDFASLMVGLMRGDIKIEKEG